MTAPFIVMCAPNGARKTKDDHPALPIAPDELAQCAGSIEAAGASIIHVHVRDDAGSHSLDPGRYRDAIAAIRERTGDRLIIQVTSEACGIFSPAEQMSMVRHVRPEAVSVALREFNPDEDAGTADFYRWLGDEGIFAQHILYSPEDVARFESLRKSGVVREERPFVLFVLGRYTSGLEGDVDSLPAYIDAVSKEVTWAVCSFGNTERAAATAAAGRGGHVRVGFENNLQLPGGEQAADNAALVAVAASVAGDRPVASATDVRAMFGLRPA